MQIDERGDEPDEAGVVARHAVLPMLRGPTKKEVVVVPGRARLLDDALEDGREGHGGHRADEEVRGHDVSVDHGRDDECARAEGGGEGEERQEGGHDGGGGCSGVGDVGEGEGFCDAVDTQMGLRINVEPTAFDVDGNGGISEIKAREFGVEHDAQ